MSGKVLCIDLGASSGRAVLAWINENEGKISAREVHRFKNRSVEVNGRLYWDILGIYSEIKTALVKAHREGGFCSVGIDTWGVDYGIIDSSGQLISAPVQYRDSRTAGMKAEAEQLIDMEQLYSLTGNQIMEINTAFQLLAEKKYRGYILENGEAMLNIPDLLGYMLTGEISSELSIASTTQLFDPKKQNWSDAAIEALGLPRRLFRKIIKPGQVKGLLRKELCEELNIPQVQVTAVCGHDTQCAFYAAPYSYANHIIISCGTWSLVGTTLKMPILSRKAMELELTNEAGYDGSIDLLKNITGLWLIQETKAYLEAHGKILTYADLENEARKCEDFTAFIDPDSPEFSKAGDIPGRIAEYCRRTEQAVPKTIGQVMRTIYLSLAMKYRLAIEQIAELTGNSYSSYEVQMAGGGIRDTYLGQLTADVTGLKVGAGPVEATVYGNALIQLIACGEIPDKVYRRRIMLRTRIDLGEDHLYKPEMNYDSEYEKFKIIIKRS